MLALIALLQPALAWEGQPGLWLPGATQMHAVSGRAGVGVLFDQSGEQLVLNGIVGATSRLAINLAGEAGRQGSGLGVGARYIVLSKEGFRLAPYAQLQLYDHHSEAWLGLAGSVTGDTVGVDASLTLIGANTSNGQGALVLPPRALAWFEAGLTFHPAHNQELRVGAISQDHFQLVATYRWHGNWWYVEPSVLYWPDDLSARAMAGVRF